MGWQGRESAMRKVGRLMEFLMTGKTELEAWVKLTSVC